MKHSIASYGVAVGLMLLASPASATTIGTDAFYNVNTVAYGPVSDQDGPYTAGAGSLLSYVAFGDSSSSFGDAVGSSSDGGGVAAGAFLISDVDTNSMDFQASSSWSDSFVNTTGAAANYDFDFNFAGGNLSLDGNGGLAMFSLNVLLDGSSIWNRTASFAGNPSSTPPSLDSDGLAHSIFASGNYVDVSFDPFSGNVDLGTIGAGDSFALTYSVDVWVSTTEDFSFAQANVGDFPNPGFSGVVNPPIVVAPVPEPAGVVLLGLGLMGLATRARKNKKRIHV